MEINEICRNRPKKPIGFIYAGILGLISFCFVDFGDHFKVLDKDGEDVYPFLISNISNTDPGVVTLIKDKSHNF
jgi:ubiquitin-activating enzyme E1